MDPGNEMTHRGVHRARSKRHHSGLLRPGSGGQRVKSGVPVYCSPITLQLPGTSLALTPSLFLQRGRQAEEESHRGSPIPKKVSSKSLLEPPAGKGPCCSKRSPGLSFPLGFSRHGVARREPVVLRGTRKVICSLWAIVTTN